MVCVNSRLRCIAICVENDAAPFEFFFAYAALALAQRANYEIAAFLASRAQAFIFYEQLAADEKMSCLIDFEALQT